jgi:uncharacterized spore protein YtfJ
MDVKELLGKVADHISVGRAFGPAYEKDGTLVIPVAFVAGGGGGGGSEVADAEVVSKGGDEADNHHSPMTGSGGGFGGVVMPVGVYVVNGERVRWLPAVNVTLLALAAISLVRLLARTRVRTVRHRS